MCGQSGETGNRHEDRTEHMIKERVIKMKKSNLSYLDSPWHIEKMVRQEGDVRRHRTHCTHYCKNNKTCRAYLSSCYGAAHCRYYKDTRF